MRYLILSDVHSNLEALEAAFKTATGMYERVLCCGDVVGYGPNPNEVIARFMAEGASTIRGNHDRAACGTGGEEWFTEAAQEAIHWTGAVLTPEHRKYLRELPPGPGRSPDPRAQLVHGSFLDEDEYVFDEFSALDNLNATDIPLTFFGHTHFPSLFALHRNGGLDLQCSADGSLPTDTWISLDSRSRYLINPGSVGQPRDGDPRAACAVFDADAYAIKFIRVRYDIAAVQEKMRRIRMPVFLIDRLSLGE